MTPQPLRPETILDAALDEEAFAALPQALATAVGARSAVVHWSMPSDTLGELRHSGYFSDAHIDLLDGRFDGHDLWADAVQSQNAIGRVWNCDDLVSPGAYENGLLYNEWVRAIGDDSFHALGFAASLTGVSMEVGLHRGRSQGSFGEGALAALSDMARPLEQLLRFRARLAQTGRANATAQAALDAHADPVLVVRPGGMLVRANAAAEALLVAGDLLTQRQGRLRALRASDDALLSLALASVNDPAAGDLLAMLDRSGHRHLLSIDATTVDGRRLFVVMVRSAAPSDRGRARRVASLYGLSTAEAGIAIAVAEGRRPDEIADDRRTSVHTVRAQLRAVLGKMGVRRQSEVAAAVASLPGVAPDRYCYEHDGTRRSVAG